MYSVSSCLSHVVSSRSDSSSRVKALLGRDLESGSDRGEGGGGSRKSALGAAEREDVSDESLETPELHHHPIAEGDGIGRSMFSHIQTSSCAGRASMPSTELLGMIAHLTLIT